jgi:S-adenosylmethionine:tRNA ribosyltransferase-isomerase
VSTGPAAPGAAHPRALAIADHSYELPAQRIAQEPLAGRDESRLLVHRGGATIDARFRDLPEHLPAGTLLVLNETRVVNARLLFQRPTGAQIEVLCLDPADHGPVEQALVARGTSAWRCLIGNAKRWREGEELLLEAGDLRLLAQRTGTDRVRFRWEPAALTFAEVLDRMGHVPLPPYMQRPDGPLDRERYNTVFARHEGSVAAPTASLHFTPGLMERLGAKGVRMTRLTLHVGAGTFLPVSSERMDGHVMHDEEVSLPLAALEALRTQLGNGPIVAVGTTALRTIESLYWHGCRLLSGADGVEMDIGQWEPYEERDEPSVARTIEAVIDDLRKRGSDRLTGRTRLLIAPGYRFKLADGLITNFHQPRSTLLLLVAAFIGPDWRKVYAHALTSDYRFLSYGDGSLLWRT